MCLNTHVSCSGLVFLVLSISHVLAKTDKNGFESCAILYEKGVSAYLENRYEDCVENFEEAIQKYRSYTKTLQNCRLKCGEEAEHSEPLYPVDVDNLYFYEKVLKNTLCIIKCRKSDKDLTETSGLSPETEAIFEERRPYEYLHLCYFQTKQAQKAASAAFTYLVVYPKNEMMLRNLKYYSNQPDVDMKEVVNFEAKDYVYLYIHGVDAYEKKDWKGVEENMEESLISYLRSEEECRAQCEGPLNHEWFPDFIPAIANHFTYCLRCKRKCSEKLNNLNGEYHDDLLASHYHFLQFAYFKSGNLKAACQAASSYVLFFPDDETMRNNLAYYKKLPKVEASYFKPRPEVVNYIRRSNYEGRLLKFIQTEYTLNNQISTEEEIVDRKETIHLIMDEKDLNGTKRFVSDGLANENDCKTLLNIAKLFAQEGDGYKGNRSPHTSMELFQGLTLSRAALLAYFGFMDRKALKLYLKITENARLHLMEQFRLNKQLYFSYTHLVCRSSLTNSRVNRTDLSHAIHADNCNLIGKSLCEKLPPAFTWRDYSAIVYLNNDFKGGEFIFTKDFEGKMIQSIVSPKCGRIVGFSSGVENLHGVKAVTKGTRCAVALWFTFNEKYAEKDRKIVYQLSDEGLDFLERFEENLD